MKKRSVIYISSIVLLVILILLLACVFPDKLDNEESKLFENLKNLFLISGGVVASILAIWRAIIADKNYENELKKLESNKEEINLDRIKFKTQQLNERYSKSIELLGNKSKSVRIGAMYTLWQLGQEDDFYSNTLNEILSSYIRNTLQSVELENNKEIYHGRLKSWESDNIANLSALYSYKEAYTTKPYQRIPEDLKSALLILNKSDFADIDLSNTDWSGFDFSELSFNEFRNINFKNVIFNHTKFSPNQAFIDCNLKNVSFDKSFLQVARFKDHHNKRNKWHIEDNGSITGTFNNALLDHLVFDKVVNQSTFQDSFFRAGLFISPKFQEKHFESSNLIFKNCFIGPIHFNTKIKNWLFSDCHFERTVLMGNNYPLRFVFFEKIKVNQNTYLFSKLNNQNLPSGLKELNHVDKNIVFMDRCTYNYHCQLFKSFNFEFLPVEKITRNIITSWPGRFKNFYEELDRKAAFHFGLIIKNKI